MQPVCGVLRQSLRTQTHRPNVHDAARMWCAEAKGLMAWAIEFIERMQPVCGVLRQSHLCTVRGLTCSDAARMWCAEAKPDDVDLHFNAT